MPSGLTRTWLGILGLQGIAGLGVLATVMIAAVAVPPAAFGTYGLMLSVVQVSYGIGFAWLNHALFRYTREEYGAQGTVTGTLFPVMIGHFLILVVAAIVAFAFQEPLSAWLTLPAGILGLCLAGLAALVMFEALTYAAQASGHFRGYGLGQLITKAGPLAAVLMFLWLPGSNAILLFAGAICGWLVALVLTGLAVPWRPAKPRPIVPVLAYGWRLPLGNAAGVLVTWMGVWFVRNDLGVAAAGLYAWAVMVFSLVAGILLPLSAVLAPRMVDLRLHGSRDAIAMQVRCTLAVAMLATAVAPAGLAVLRLFGSALPEAYAPSLPLIILLYGAAPAQLLAYTLNPLLMAHERLVTHCIVANVSIALMIAAGNMVLVPLAGMIGAALTTLLALWVAAAIWICVAATLVPHVCGVWRPWTSITLPAVVATVAVGLLPWAMALVAGIGVTIVLLLAGRRLSWFGGVEAVCVHLPRQVSSLSRGLRWCARTSS